MTSAAPCPCYSQSSSTVVLGCLCRVAARYKQTGVGDPSGKLVGKAALKAYFQEALDNLAVIRLDLQV